MTSSDKPWRVLHLVASPREASRSRATAQAYLDTLQQSTPNLMLETLDLWRLELPDIDGAVLDAKYAILAGKPHQPREALAWQRVQALTGHLLSFDHYVLSIPMWNLGIPYRLKHYIDVVTQPGLTFSWTPERGYEGLVHGRSAVVAYASAFDYSPGTALQPWDQQKPYAETWLRFIGVHDIQTIDCGPTRPGMPGMAEAQAAAEARARQLGQERSARA